MTKEELAKKRGVKISQEKPSPSEALLTTKPQTKKNTKPAPKKKVNTSKSTVSVNKKPADVPSPVMPEPVKEQQEKAEKPVLLKDLAVPARNKGGRPRTRTEEVKIANIAIPVSVYNDMTAHALAVYNNNLTGYINALIKKDLDANLENYKKVSAFMQQAKGV